MRRKAGVPHNQYLQQRRRTWYVRVAVPPSLVPTVGKTHIVRSLKTRDVVVARERRWEAVADIRKWLQAQSKAPVDPVARGIEDRDWWLSQDDKVPDPDTRHTDRDAAKLIITDIAEEIEGKQSRDAALTYFKIATSTDPVLRDVERRWLEEVSGEVAGQTLGNHRFALDLLHKHNASLLFVGQVDRRAAGRFISEAVRPGRKPATVNRIISSLSSCWRWMIGRGLTDSNPWEGQGVKRPKGKPKRPYEAGELLRLLNAEPARIVGKRYGPALQDLLRLSLMTGARLDELCELRVQDVDLNQRTIWIRRGKTEAAKRIIPVHPTVWPIIQRRSEGALDGELFPELPPQGPDSKKSWYTSKRFTEFRRRVLGEDSTIDFHSLRRTFTTYLDRAQGHTLAVHPGVIAELMGHEKGTLALSVYSGGHRIEHLRKAVDALELVIEPEVLKAVSRGDAQANLTSKNGAAALSGGFSEGPPGGSGPENEAGDGLQSKNNRGMDGSCLTVRRF